MVEWAANFIIQKIWWFSKKIVLLPPKNKNRDVAQLVAYTYGVRVVAGSSPVIPTFLLEKITTRKGSTSDFKKIL